MNIVDLSAHTLVAGDLQVVFLPNHGMLGASLRYKGVEILRRVENLEAAAARGSSAGIPLLHPWANRLSEPRYRALGQQVVLDRSSPLLHFDEHGPPMRWIDTALDFPHERAGRSLILFEACCVRFSKESNA